ncbi:hypothetical protein COLO4_07445 [Corchorus olitorius]|uniref:Uncharacterized protein n=1 Tax=Corchorus olitorius TaxID=93759 RepID=A0A1R3KJU8_9ROSI|nr:hypothetical protein COLO4_07445 [Corchorus olitorius]
MVVQIKTFWEGVPEATGLAKKVMDINEDELNEETIKEKDNDLLKRLALSNDEATNKEKEMQARALEEKQNELAEKQKQAKIAARKQGEVIAKKMIEETTWKKKGVAEAAKEAENLKQLGDVVELVQPSISTKKTADTEVIHSSLTITQRL